MLLVTSSTILVEQVTCEYLLKAMKRLSMNCWKVQDVRLNDSMSLRRFMVYGS